MNALRAVAEEDRVSVGLVCVPPDGAVGGQGVRGEPGGAAAARLRRVVGVVDDMEGAAGVRPHEGVLDRVGEAREVNAGKGLLGCAWTGLS